MWKLKFIFDWNVPEIHVLISYMFSDFLTWICLTSEGHSVNLCSMQKFGWNENRYQNRSEKSVTEIGSKWKALSKMLLWRHSSSCPSPLSPPHHLTVTLSHWRRPIYAPEVGKILKKGIGSQMTDPQITKRIRIRIMDHRWESVILGSFPWIIQNCQKLG